MRPQSGETYGHVAVGMSVFDCNAVPLGTVAELFGAIFRIEAIKASARWNQLWLGLDQVADLTHGQRIDLRIAANQLEEFGFRHQASA